ncbi:MAG: hypothetical protein JSR98_21885 [Proteobacteria bacterium]|nr:hypothetical protein [Pseudomonadota bacterium]
MSTRLASLRLHVCVLSLLSTAAVSGCAAAAPYNPANLSAARLAQVDELCASTIGLKPGFTADDACVESLSTSAARLDRAGVREAAHRTCLDQGAGAGATLARCELDAADRAGATASATGGAAASAHPAKPFYRASSREARTREQRACAGLGYDPTSGGFASCVASLDAALYAADHPQP